MKNFATQKNFRVTTILMILILVLMLPTKSIAQENLVYDYKSLLANTQDVKRENDLTKMQSLVADLLPSISVSQGKVQRSGDDDAISLETDALSFAEIQKLNSLTTKVQIIKIKLNSSNDLSQRFDLASLAAMENLRYVYIICPFEANASQVSNLLRGSNNNVIVIYTAALPK